MHKAHDHENTHNYIHVNLRLLFQKGPHVIFTKLYSRRASIINFLNGSQVCMNSISINCTLLKNTIIGHIIHDKISSTVIE